MGRISQAYTYKHFLLSFQETHLDRKNLIASTLCFLNFSKEEKSEYRSIFELGFH